MTYQKPLVTIELEEYNKMLNYIKVLDESIGETPYKKALEEIVYGMHKSNSIITDLIVDSLRRNKIQVDITRKNIYIHK